MKKILVFSLILIGITAISSQIILIREFLTVFYGNELSIGLLLFIWLLGSAIGSVFASVIYKKESKRYFINFSNSQIALSIFIPFSIILTRITREVFKINLGELITMPVMFMWGAICLAPMCAILGFMFVTGCELYKHNNGFPEKKIITTYFLESLGAVFGGFITTFLLIRFFNNLEIAFLISFLNLTAAYFVISSYSVKARLKKFTILTMLLLFLAMVLLGGVKFLDRNSLKLKWKGTSLIDTRDSIYGNVTLTRISDQYTFFSNGLLMGSVPDKLVSEALVHPSMLIHEKPKNILLIGGGQTDILDEIIKYPITKVTYIELDPLVISITKDHLKEQSWYKLNEPKVDIVNMDARFFIKNTDQSFDVVFINLPNPYTAQINRFYTLEFYKELSRILNKNAIISFGVVSSENYISYELKEFLRSIYYTLKKVFPDVKIIPGDTAYFLASNNAGVISLDYNFIEKRRLSKGIHTDFIRPYYLFSKLSPERIAYINKSILSKDDKENEFSFINTDFRPISYYYDMVLWSTYLSYRFSRFFKFLIAIKIWRIFAVFSVILIFFAYLKRKNKYYKKIATLFALGTTGFSEITFQILIILAFQVIYGYIYYKLGMIFTFFMLGLVVGSFYMMGRIDRIKQPYNTYIKIQFAVLAYPIVLIGSFYLISKNPDLLFKMGSEIIFSSLPFIAGFVGGLQFPVANKIYLSKTNSITKSAGITYASDLLGASIGAILISAFTIPIIGIYGTCIGIMLLNLVALIILFLGKNTELG